ncbi:nuclear pore complex subunit nup85 [Stemphylium lycopersici]|nr:nuclear pore complex subunit nup85 [Stemphylium lycopersici]RAQ99433.1 nuclear pore complex subunit nup85 [Stemphylium lycopersici]
MFRVPSPTPPSTPGRDYYGHSQHAPSTTPAGPAPDESLYPSSTPGGPPPGMSNGLFGTSRPSFDPNRYQFAGNSLFGSSPPKHDDLLEGVGSGSIGTSTIGRPHIQRSRPNSGQFAPPKPPSKQALNRDAEGDTDEDDYTDEDDEDDDMDEDEGSEDEEESFSAQRRNKAQSKFSQSAISRTSANDMEPGPTYVRPGAKQTQFDLLALAKGLTSNNGRPTIREVDSVILETERLLEKVNESLHSDSPEKRADVIGEVAHELIATWRAVAKSNTRADMSSSRSGSTIQLEQATQLAALLLTLHHPPQVGLTQRASALSLVPARSESKQYTPIPKALLDWLNSTFDGGSEVKEVLKQKGGYSRHPSFWEVVHVTITRGNFAQTLQLLQGAQLEHAETAALDGLGDTGYTGTHLQHANHVLRQALDLLRECPAIASEDWDIKGHDWTIFRQRVQQISIELEDFAEGESVSRHSVSQPFQASHFGISQSQASFQLSVASRKAESKVPWSVYENLGRMYQLLLGNEEEILTLSADWIEATVGLTVWWNGEEEEVAQGSLAASRRSIMRSQRVRPVDVTPIKAYSQRLSSALAAVIQNSDEDFGINAVDCFEVGLACVLDDNAEGALQILQGWSLTMASAVAEIASAGEWFKGTKGLLDQFDQSDLMVLSYSEEQQPKGVTKDDLLVAYSKLLTSKQQITGKDDQASKEGWELAVQILGRLDDTIAANGRIERILNDLPLESSTRVDKITQLCHNLGLSQHAVTIAQKYADHLRTNTESYGDTLMYYARAHDAPRIQEVLRVLVAHCLVKSTAYPPLDELDESLSSLITSPKQALTKLANTDSEAASLLSNHLSGYATIRKYYDLRDEEVLLKIGEKPAHRPMARKRAAANALMVIIASAASSIRGGLYDPEIETVVPVDVLLPLLGEALIFVNQPKRTLTLRHLYDLLTAVEDLDTAPSMIRAQCEEVLSTTLLSAHDPNSSQQLPNPHNLLSKSTSNLAASQYSLIGSMDFGSADGQSAEGSTILVKGGHVDDSKRGWDWRKGFPKGAKSEDIIAVLRLGVAREIGRAFAEGEVTTA